MITDLFFAPKLPPPPSSLTRRLKYLLAPTYFGHDGSLTGRATLTLADVPFLSGIKTATHDTQIASDTQRLIDAIEHYGAVEIWLEG